MENVLNVAQYIFNEYKNMSGEVIDEMKLHKLLYFSQRESLAIVDKPMFDAEFEGWRLGPVCKQVRSAYVNLGKNPKDVDIAFDNAYIVRSVIAQYGVIESWELSKMSHREVSWKNSRIGLNNDDVGTMPLKLSDIRTDAAKVRPYDDIWDMYYDELDTIYPVNV